MLTLTTEQMKKAEKLTDKAGLSYLEMMKNAGVTSYKYLDERYELNKKNCVVLCGAGNNGGDGFVLARKMVENGSNVSVILCCGMPKTNESQIMFDNIKNLDIEIISLNENLELAKNKIDTAQMVVDAVFGTGFKGQLPPNVKRIFEYINHSITIRVALDIPSGIGADNGECCESPFEAEATCCYMALKPAHLMPYVKNVCGHIEILDIGIPNDIITIVQSNITLLMEEIITSILPKRNQYTHKGNYGKLLNICGSKNMCGAAMMATLSSMRIGAGVVTLATPKSVARSCCSNLMEAMTLS
ncbi:MAG: NAD(P)H-hydrate epimerase, partial [Oscillospiraceae bacterium]